MGGPGTRCRKSRELHGGSEMEHQRNLRWSGNGDRGCSRLQRGWLSGEDRGKLEESGYSFPKGRSWVWSCRWALGLEVEEHRGDPKGTVCGRDMEWSKANSKGGRVVRLGRPRREDRSGGTHDPLKPLSKTAASKLSARAKRLRSERPARRVRLPPTSPQHSSDPPHSRSSVRDSAALAGGVRSRSRNPERTRLLGVRIGSYIYPSFLLALLTARLQET